MAIKALVLDLDATLYSKSKLHKADAVCASRVIKYLRELRLLSKIPNDRLKEIKKRVTQGSVSLNVRELSSEFGLDYTKFNHYVNDVNPKAFGIGHDSRLVSLIGTASRKYRVFVFTNSPWVWTKKVIAGIGLGRLIPRNRVVYSELMGQMLKPEPKAFLAMLRIIGIKENEIVFIDDNPKNIAQARRLGISAVLVSNSPGSSMASTYRALERINKRNQDR